MTSKYDHHDKDTLVRMPERRDAEHQLGLVWKRENDEVTVSHLSSAKD